ncbi:hypothetical protein DFH28DRAFT_905376 [Melampsora americana]|nr:hypothetical protein DFH28DRAFT_905376 [Melampsora americana]
MQNDQDLSRQEIERVNNATSVYEKIDALLFKYDKAGGSNSIEMRTLRDWFAELVPPTDRSVNNFIYNFSVFARAAIELDSRSRRPLWKMVGENYPFPSSAKDLMDSDPIVLYTGCIFRPPADNELRYQLPRDLLTEVGNARSAARYDTAEEAANSRRRDSGQRSRSPRRSSRRASPDRRRRSPRSSPRRSFHSRSPPRRTHHSENRSRRRSRSPKRRSRSPRRHIRSPRRRSGTPEEPRPASSSPASRGMGHRPESPRPSTSQPSSNKRARFEEPAESNRPTSLLDRIDTSLFNRIDHEAATRRDKGKQRRISPSPEPATSNDIMEGVFKKFIASIGKPRKRLACQSADDEEFDDNLPATARIIKRIKLEYKEDICTSIDAFESCRRKPDRWPTSQSKDLLSYNYVDLEKVNAEVFGKPGSAKSIKINDSKDLEFEDKIRGTPINNVVHWLELIGILRQAYSAAFPPAKEAFEKYFDHIVKQAGKASRGIHWKDVRDYDAEMRMEFSRNSWISFGDWMHEELDGIKSKHLFSKTSRLYDDTKTAEPNYNYAKPATKKTSSSSSWSKPKRKSPAKQPRSRIDFPYTIKDSSRNQTMTATENISYATKWDAMPLIEESSRTHRVNSRKFLRGLEIEEEAAHFSASVDSSITADPLPDAPPLSEDPMAARALRKDPHLFKIVCPIKTSRLERLTKSHPNQPFVQSILKGLRHGFWPMSSPPSQVTCSHPNHVGTEEGLAILRKTRDKDVKSERFSEGFHSPLQGMKCAPLCLATNKHSGKTRMCTNMSFGSPSPNDLIDKAQIKIKLDSIASFIPSLVRLRKEPTPHDSTVDRFVWTPRKPRSDRKVVIWKSDVDSAFRILPVHLQWQLRQIIKVDNLFHIDRCVNFGCAGSPKIWCSFFSLVLWIARYELGITDLNSYMDDSWGASLAAHTVSFKDHRIPLNQAKFLTLFDYLGIPWAWEKQLWGGKLEIIGHLIDCDTMIIALAEEKRMALALQLETFASSMSQPLIEWQRLTGWANWALNTFPLGRWALQSSWDKIAGKTLRNAHVPLNKTTKEDLRWLAEELRKWNGRSIMNSFHWDLTLADMIFFCDACPTGIGIWNPRSNETWDLTLPPPSRDIYWAELLAVVLAIELSLATKPKRLLIFTDNESVCYLFSTHCPTDSVRKLFRHAVSRMLDNSLDITVRHVAGERNGIADSLSRGNIIPSIEAPPSRVHQTLPAIPKYLDGGIRRSK